MFVSAAASASARHVRVIRPTSAVDVDVDAAEPEPVEGEDLLDGSADEDDTDQRV
jgi:hypothetical protein